MDKKTCNPSIRCDVSSCAHHTAENCCCLSQIQVGCCGCTPPRRTVQSAVPLHPVRALTKRSEAEHRRGQSPALPPLFLLGLSRRGLSLCGELYGDYLYRWERSVI